MMTRRPHSVDLAFLVILKEIFDCIVPNTNKFMAINSDENF